MEAKTYEQNERYYRRINSRSQRTRHLRDYPFSCIYDYARAYVIRVSNFNV